VMVQNTVPVEVTFTRSGLGKIDVEFRIAVFRFALGVFS
jgi:hypothetical protein